MARFNFGKFNLAKYNRTVDAPATLDKLQIGAIFQAIVGLGQTTKDALMLQASFATSAKMASGTLGTLTLGSEFSEEIIGKYIAYSRDSLAAEFSEESYLSPLVKDKSAWNGIFEVVTYMAPKVRDELVIGSDIDCVTYLGNKIMDVAGVMAYAIFDAVMSAETYEEIVMDLAVTIPKRGVLVIDSDNFRVLLNGQNVIKYHSGDWINELCRQSSSITISGGGNSLEATVYFQELWL